MSVSNLRVHSKPNDDTVRIIRNGECDIKLPICFERSPSPVKGQCKPAPVCRPKPCRKRSPKPFKAVCPEICAIECPQPKHECPPPHCCPPKHHCPPKHVCPPKHECPPRHVCPPKHECPPDWRYWVEKYAILDYRSAPKWKLPSCKLSQCCCKHPSQHDSDCMGCHKNECHVVKKCKIVERKCSPVKHCAPVKHCPPVEYHSPPACSPMPRCPSPVRYCAPVKCAY